ncbi:hypothetical protein V8E36_001422 [Tilletia maclaganii]
MRYLSLAYGAFVLAALAQQAQAQPAPSPLTAAVLGPASGALCDPRKNVIDPLTHRFRSDCGPREWCLPNPLDPSLITSTPSMPADVAARPDTASTQEAAVSSTSSDGDDAIWRRSIWDTVDDWHSFRRALAADETDGFNLSDSTEPIRVSLPDDAKPSGTSASGLPTPTSGVCRPKGCRRDEYPFGYKGVPQDQIPPMCGQGTYCPDEEVACRPLIPLGGICQLNRDGESDLIRIRCRGAVHSCSPPNTVPMPSSVLQPVPSSSSISSSPASSPSPMPSSTSLFDPPLPSGLARRIYDTLMGRRDVGIQVATAPSSSAALNGSIQASPETSGVSSTTSTVPVTALGAAKPMCLQGVCHLADASRGQACIIDHTQYLGYDSNGKEVIDTIRCDLTRVCLPEKAQGGTCAADRECLEFNCNYKGVCDLPPEAPNRLPAWAFVMIGLAILSSLIITVYGLYRIHLAHRASRAEEIDRYFSEQWTFRQSILSMHAAALAVTGGMALGRSTSKDSGSGGSSHGHGPTTAAAVAGGIDPNKHSMLVGSPNGSVFMSPLGDRHLRILSVDRRDSDDSEGTLYHHGQPGLVHPLHQQHNLQRQQMQGQRHATGVQAGYGLGIGTPNPDSNSSSPFLDGRLSKRKPAPAA